MKKLLVLQHVPHEGLGTLDALLQNAGVGVDTIHFWREPKTQPSLDGYDGLVILGGPMGVYDAKKNSPSDGGNQADRERGQR